MLRSVRWLLPLALVAACSHQSGRTSQSFCAHFKAAQPAMSSSPGNAKAIAQQFHLIGAHAPTAIRPSWDRLTKLFDALSQVDQRDNVAVQQGYQLALDPTVQAAATKARNYLKSTCGLDAGASLLTPAPTTITSSTTQSN